MTNDSTKTKAQLIDELQALRRATKCSDSDKSNDMSCVDAALARLLLQESMDPILMGDASTGILLDCNQAAEVFFDYPRAQLIGMHQRELHPLELVDGEFSDSFRKHVANPGELVEVPILTGSDNIKIASVKACKTTLDGREFILGIFRDVTQSMVIEKELKAMQERFQAMFTNMASGVAVYEAVDDGADFIFKDFNPTAEKITRITREKAVGQRLLTLFPHMDKSGLLSALTRVWKTGQSVDIPPFHYKDDTREGWRENHIYKLPSGEVVALFTDVTERMEALNALKASEQRFRALLENVDMVAVQGYDLDRRVVYWNQASTQLYGYSKEEAMGQRLEDLIIPEPMQATVIQHISNWNDNGIPIPPGELDLIRKDGSAIPVYSSHVMQKAADGSQTMYCIDVELSEVRRVCNELRQAKEEAEIANHAKSEFLANMSHEIRTPLNGILGMLQLLQTTQLDEEQDSYALNAANSSKRLTALLSDILDLSRVEAGRMPLTLAPLTLPRLLDQLKELFMPMDRQAEVSLICRTHPDTQCQLLGDALRVQQVLNNLVGNAFKFTTSGTITVETYPLPAPSPDKAKVLFSVTDTGVGIPDGKVEELFKPFIQGSTGLTKTHQGAGLGLSISKRMIDLMGGNMALESEVNVGTTVYFCITFDLPETISVQEPETEQTANDITGLKILLAEDEHVNSLIAARLLEKSGANVTVARDGQQTLDALKKQDFDLVLMDIQMPVMDGMETTAAIRQGKAGTSHTAIPIIAMTAHAMVGDRELFLASGMDDYLAKPIEIESLYRAINATMTKK